MTTKVQFIPLYFVINRSWIVLLLKIAWAVLGRTDTVDAHVTGINTKGSVNPSIVQF